MGDAVALKQAVAQAVFKQVPLHGVIGVGTGSTVNAWIECLAEHRSSIDGAVASSEDTARRLHEVGVPVVDLNGADVSVYIDGADEVNDYFQLIKGGGAALTREKIVAAAARRFVVLIDHSKRVRELGRKHPLPIEVIPMARGFVARECIKLGGQPVYREGVVTDNGNIIIDVHHCPLAEPLAMERQLNQIPGVVCHGLFASVLADEVYCAMPNGQVERLTVKA